MTRLKKYIKSVGQNLKLNKWLLVELWEHEGKKVWMISDFVVYLEAQQVYHSNSSILVSELEHWERFWKDRPDIKTLCNEFKIIPCSSFENL